MAEKLILNSGAPVVISTEIGNININGHNQLTKITQEQYKALMEKQDFKLWVEKGYIIINAPVRNVEDTTRQNLILVGFKNGENVNSEKYDEYKNLLDMEITNFSSDREVVTDHFAPIGD